MTSIHCPACGQPVHVPHETEIKALLRKWIDEAARLVRLCADLWSGGEALWERCDRTERALEVESLRTEYWRAYCDELRGRDDGRIRAIVVREDLRAKGEDP